MKTIARALALVGSLALSPVLSHADEIGADVADLPIFDAHMHYKRSAWEPYPVETVIKLMDKFGVAMALVSSTPDEGTIRLWEYAPPACSAEPYQEKSSGRDK